jgi:hypothetical protein
MGEVNSQDYIPIIVCIDRAPDSRFIFSSGWNFYIIRVIPQNLNFYKIDPVLGCNAVPFSYRIETIIPASNIITAINEPFQGVSTPDFLCN